MNDYIHPIRDMQGALTRSRHALYVLGALLALSILAVPWILRQGPVVVLDQDGFFRTAHSKPWQLTTSRLEGFARIYLAARWEWTSETFDERRKSLQEILVPELIPKLKDSLQGLESVAKLQHARSYFVLEGWGFSNEKRKVELRIIRVIRIRNAAISTPMMIHLVLQESPLTETNPYGLLVESLEESEVKEGGDT